MTYEEDTKPQFLQCFLGIIVLLSVMQACNNNQPGSPGIDKSKNDSVILKKDSSKAIAATVVEDSTKKKIYLTFDDGPNPGTANVLDILDQEKVPATFFLIGEHRYYGPEEQRDWDRLQANKQLVLCNHSYTHAWRNRFDKYYAHPNGVIADFTRCQDSLKFNNRIGRTPGRNTWRLNTINYTDMRKTKAAVDSLGNAGFVMMGWDAEWRYIGRTQKLINDADYMLDLIDSLFKNNKTRTPNHLVLLAHDRTFADVEDSTQLELLIQGLKQHPEYEFRLATTYPGSDKPYVTQ